MNAWAVGKFGVVWVLAGAGLAAQVAPIPSADELPGQPFVIKKKWVIGGAGNWDYLTMDALARQLFIAHQTQVQVVEVDSGKVAGEVSGFSEAHSVALDPDGQWGYVSDGRANLIQVFDRRTFEVVAKISLGASPRALAFEPKTGLLFAFGSLPAPPATQQSHRQPVHPSHRPPVDRSEIDPCSAYGDSWPPPTPYESLISIIDPDKRTKVADVQVCGILGAAQADGDGQVYFTIVNFNEVGRLNAQAIQDLAQHHAPADLRSLNGSVSADGTLLLDFKMSTTTGAGTMFRTFRLGQECQDARAVAVDAANARIFAGCANQKLKVIAADTGGSVAALTIGPGVDAMAYDAARGLIFTANGGGYGSVTVVRQHLTDSYAVIQNLPTLQQARTIAVDPSTGLVYLVTTLYGADLKDPPKNGIGTLKLNPVDGMFQVLVVGN